jgi:transcriptional regulator with PAS, ATPase and Fis domain
VKHNSQAAVIVHGADTIITNCNKVSLEITGLTQDQIIGKDAMDPSWKFFSADGIPLSQDEYPVNKVLHSKTVLKNMLVGIYRPETNDTVKVLVNAVPIFDVVGNVSEVIVTFMDITDRIKIENEREKLLESLQIALDEIKTLKGVIPICSNCKKIRDDTGYWNQLESYIQKYSDAAFSHGICPECVEELYGKQD